MLGRPALDVCLVHATEQDLHLEQSGIDHDSDGAQRVIRWHEIIQVAHREQALGEGVGSAHFCIDVVAACITSGYLCPWT